MLPDIASERTDDYRPAKFRFLI